MDILTVLIIALGINFAMFIPAFWFKTDKLTDVSYAATFGIIALLNLFMGAITLPSTILTTVILVWAIRLGGYLFIRINKTGKDARFDKMRKSFWHFGRFWLIQGFTVWVILLPSIFFWAKDHVSFPWYSYIGLALFALGLVIETVADTQKFKFISNSANKGKWIESGLWKYSRHPNYFGEIIVWLGLYLYVFYALNMLESMVGAIGPLYIALLIIFGSGIPILEKNADKKWGHNPDYQNYKKSTPVLVPWFRKKV